MTSINVYETRLASTWSFSRSSSLEAWVSKHEIQMNFQKSRFFILFSLFSKFHETQKIYEIQFFSLHIATTNFKISIHTFHLKFVLLAPIHHSPVRFLNLGTFCWHWTVPHQIREEFSEKSFIPSELLTQLCQFQKNKNKLHFNLFGKTRDFFVI